MVENQTPSDLTGGSAESTGSEATPVLDQRFDDTTLYALRAAVEAHGSEIGLPEGKLGDLVLAAYELATNAIRHGGGEGRLRLWSRPGELRCEVHDNGSGIPTDPARWPFRHGRGLWLIRLTADTFTVTTDGTGSRATATFLHPDPTQDTGHAVDVTSADGLTTITLTGTIDQSSAAHLTAIIDAALTTTDTQITIELTETTSLDSIGLAALVTAHQRIADHPQAGLVLAGVSADLAARLDCLGFVTFTYKPLRSSS